MTGLPPISDAAIPADVRKAGGTKQYKAALGFESMLLDQLSQEMVKNTSLEDSPYSGQIQQAFSTGLLQGGGIGLAGTLYQALKS